MKIPSLAGRVAVGRMEELVGARGLAAQTEQAYRNVDRAFKELGASFSDIARLTVYVVDWSRSRRWP
jgi:enamine deaminase RidA (YjgF/YER057c/UK114 family)